MTNPLEAWDDTVMRRAIGKILRALEDGTGVSLSAQELQELAGRGVIDHWMKAIVTTSGTPG